MYSTKTQLSLKNLVFLVEHAPSLMSGARTPRWSPRKHYLVLQVGLRDEQEHLSRTLGSFAWLRNRGAQREKVHQTETVHKSRSKLMETLAFYQADITLQPC